MRTICENENSTLVEANSPALAATFAFALAATTFAEFATRAKNQALVAALQSAF